MTGPADADGRPTAASGGASPPCGDASSGPVPAGDLQADYAAHGFAARLGFGSRPAVLVVDGAMAYLDPASPLYAGVEEAVASAARVVEAARAAGHPVVHSRVVIASDGSDAGHFWRKVPALRVFVAGSPLGEPVPALAPRAGEVVVTKQYASAFFGTPLASTLHGLGVDTVVVVGLTTSGCVRASTLDALQYGFVPVVVADAVGDRDPRPHEASLLDLGAKYADVVGEAEAVAELRRIPPLRSGTTSAHEA
jgi:maleamate amidohydrolase